MDKDVMDMTDEEVKEYCEDYAKQGKWESERLQKELVEGSTYRQIAYWLQTS